MLAERTITRLRSQPARVSVSAVPDPVTATVFPRHPDGSLGPQRGSITTPGILTVPAGSYRLHLSREGYLPEEADFDAHWPGAVHLASAATAAAPGGDQCRAAGAPVSGRSLSGRHAVFGPDTSGNHRLRVERRLFLTQLRPLELAPGVAPLHFRVSLERSGLIDMALGGMIAGAGLGLMVLRLFLGEEIETLPRQEFCRWQRRRSRRRSGRRWRGSPAGRCRRARRSSSSARPAGARSSALVWGSARSRRPAAARPGRRLWRGRRHPGRGGLSLRAAVIGRHRHVQHHRSVERSGRRAGLGLRHQREA